MEHMQITILSLNTMLGRVMMAQSSKHNNHTINSMDCHYMKMNLYDFIFWTSGILAGLLAVDRSPGSPSLIHPWFHN